MKTGHQPNKQLVETSSWHFNPMLFDSHKAFNNAVGNTMQKKCLFLRFKPGIVLVKKWVVVVLSQRECSVRVMVSNSPKNKSKAYTISG